LKVYKSIEGLNIKNPVATIGMFDGVHLGHREIIKSLIELARQNNGESVLLSFWPHPRMIFQGNNNLRLLTTIDEKAVLLEQSGIDHFVIVPFNRDFANISYKSFVKEYLVKKLKIKTIIMGYNHQFGKNREGNFEKLVELGRQFDFIVNKLDPQIVDNEKVSSSLIRNALQDGNIKLANRLLGYEYNFTGFVVEGNKNGRSIGFPTANLYIREPYKLIPGMGVYAVTVKMGPQLFKGMMNIGFRPTIAEDNKQKTVEVHLFDTEMDLYGKELTIFVRQKTRDEKQFQSLQSLKKQLSNDKAIIKQILG
jgi:riboflavin kinase / FMN adenylyltransferase